MKFSALALDYDGTIATDGVFDPAVREAVGDAGDLTGFDVIAAENGAMLESPASGRQVLIGHTSSPAFLQELQRHTR